MFILRAGASKTARFSHFMKKIKADYWTLLNFGTPDNPRYKLFGWTNRRVIKDYSGLTAKKMAGRFKAEGHDVSLVCTECGSQLSDNVCRLCGETSPAL
jgi:hypothetical protein